MQYESQQILNVLNDAPLQQKLYGATARNQAKRRNVIPPAFQPEFQKLREAARDIKRHTLDYLDYYLEQAEAQVTAHGGHVFWARDAAEATSYVLDVMRRRGARLLVKSKSMTTEEIHLNDRLEDAGLEAVETDLGEFIIQLNRERPYHIVTPALHKDRYDVADIFERTLGVGREEVPEKQTLIARRILREKFLAAGVGVSGANFVVAETGTVVIVENEGNARLSSSAPPVHIAVAGIEKLVPRLADLGVFLNILARSATGQALSIYTSMLSGPRREGEIDGPEEFHLILLDNGRSRVLAGRERRETLQCIRCGACLNHCPVFRKIGGHVYPGTYSGPIGAILTPQLSGPQEAPWLPFASSLCGACAEVCPVKIDIPKLLLSLRAEIVESAKDEKASWAEKLAFRFYAWLMKHPRLFDMAGEAGTAVLPLLGLPGREGQSFRRQWRQRSQA